MPTKSDKEIIEDLKKKLKQAKRKNKSLEEELMKDHLTGLKNWQYLKEESSILLKRAARYGEYACVFFIDMDDFKKINDQFGHRTADGAIIYFSKMLRETASRAGDIVVRRYKGDEFVIFCILEDPEKIRAFYEKIQKKVSLIYYYYGKNGEKQLPLKASVGNAFKKVTEENLFSLLEILTEEADHAMIKQKSLRKKKK